MISRIQMQIRHVSPYHAHSLAASLRMLEAPCRFVGTRHTKQPTHQNRVLSDDDLFGDVSTSVPTPIVFPAKERRLARQAAAREGGAAQPPATTGSTDPFLTRKSNHAPPRVPIDSNMRSVWKGKSATNHWKEKISTRSGTVSSKPHRQATQIQDTRGQKARGSEILKQTRLMKACGEDWKRAHALLDTMSQTKMGISLAAYNEALFMCARAKQPLETSLILLRMRGDGVQPDLKSYSAAMNASAKAGNWQDALGLLDQMENEDGLTPDVYNYSAVISACEKSGEWERALGILEHMNTVGVSPNVVTFSAAISACEKGGQWEKAVELLDSMKGSGVEPNVITFSAAISACEKGGQGEKALELFDEMAGRGIEPNVYSFSAAISACGKSGNWKKALDLLYSMKDRGARPNVQCFGAAIAACQKSRQWKKALETVENMHKSGLKPNVLTYSSIISTCEKAGQWEQALEMFHSMESQGVVPNVYCYSTAISACETGAQWEKALELLNSMETRGVKPNVIAFNAAISACGKGNQWGKALELLKVMGDRGVEPDVISFSAAISACEKSGEWEKALEVFRSMAPHGVTPNALTFSAVITACGKRGQWKTALKLFESMEVVGVPLHDSPLNACIETLDKASRHDEAAAVMRLARAGGLLPRAWASESKVDVHDCSAAMAKAIMRCVLGDLKVGTRTLCDIVIVVGRGNGSGVKGAVLPDTLRAFFDDKSLKVSKVPGNAGRLMLRRDDLHRWLKVKANSAAQVTEEAVVADGGKQQDSGGGEICGEDGGSDCGEKGDEDADMNGSTFESHRARLSSVKVNELRRLLREHGKAQLASVKAADLSQDVPLTGLLKSEAVRALLCTRLALVLTKNGDARTR